jgi:hypothetical protein
MHIKVLQETCMLALSSRIECTTAQDWLLRPTLKNNYKSKSLQVFLLWLTVLFTLHIRWLLLLPAPIELVPRPFLNPAGFQAYESGPLWMQTSEYPGFSCPMLSSTDYPSYRANKSYDFRPLGLLVALISKPYFPRPTDKWNTGRLA